MRSFDLRKNFDPRNAGPVDSSGLCHGWGVAIRHADVPGVARLLKQGISPNQPINIYRASPLKEILLMDDNPALYPHQATIVQMLIGHGAELGVPDHRILLPADYALISKNTDAAMAVILATVEHFSETRKAPYRPSYNRLFSNIFGSRKRPERIEQMDRNLRAVHAHFNAIIEKTRVADIREIYRVAGPLLINDPPKPEDLPRQSPERRHALMQRHKAWKAVEAGAPITRKDWYHLEKTRTDILIAEAQQARNLKP